MRSLSFVLCMLCLAGLSASSASATDSDWVLFVTAGYDGTFGAIYGQNGELWAQSLDDPGVVDDPLIKDSKDGKPTPPFGNPAAAVRWWRPWVADGRYDIFTRDVRQPLATAPGYVKRWDDMLIWASHGSPAPYPGDDILVFISGAGVPNSINGQPIVYRLIMTWAPEAYWNDPSKQKEWVLPPFPGSSNPSVKLPWFAFSLPVEGALASYPVLGDGPLAATQVAGYRFSLVTPEPASLVALAVGLASLAARLRRR